MKLSPAHPVVLISLLCLIALLGLSSCGHGARAPLHLSSRYQPRELLKLACGPARDIRVTKGSAQMSVKSREASGRFSSLIEARSPSYLKLEVLTPLGGTYAVLTVDGADYVIDVPGHPERNRSGSDNWAGIRFSGPRTCSWGASHARLRKMPIGRGC